MKNTPPKPRQTTLLGYFGQSSSPQPEASSSKNSSPKTPRKPPRKRKAPPPRRLRDPPSDDECSSASSNVGEIGFEPQVVTVSSDEEDEDIRSPRRPPAIQRAARKLKVESDSAGSSAAVSNASDEDEPSVTTLWKEKKTLDLKGKRKRTVLDTDSDEDVQPRKSKLVKGVRPQTPEEDEDEVDLMDEVDEKKIIQSRLRTRDKKSLYLQNLEKLKRKKRKERVESSSEEEEEDDAGNSEDDDGVIPGAKPHQEGHTDDEDEDNGADDDLDDFIEEDNGAPVELPAEFSMSTYQDLMHHFKNICQLFVHLAVQPAEEKRTWMEQALKDKYFAVPLQIARRKIEGMRDSLVTSSVWRTAFKKPLETYPDFETFMLDFAVPHCDACHLGGRMSKFVGRLSGEPYDKVTFETLSDPDTSSDDEDEEEVESRKEFNLGRFCARRTRVFHMFTHWEYALYKILEEEIDNLRNRGKKNRVYIPVARADGVQPPDDLSDADALMNWLDERGIITEQWDKIKKMMDNARNLEIASKRGEDDD